MKVSKRHARIMRRDPKLQRAFLLALAAFGLVVMLGLVGEHDRQTQVLEQQSTNRNF